MMILAGWLAGQPKQDVAAAAKMGPWRLVLVD